MTGFRVGDRVRLEGVVTEIDDNILHVRTDAASSRWLGEDEVELVERPAPALKVGDVVKGLPDLPLFSIVTDKHGTAWQRMSVRWHPASPQFTTALAGDMTQIQFTVLHIGGGS